MWESLLDLQVKRILYEVCSVTTLLTVPIANAKHVHALPFLHVRGQYESILVHFVGITWLKSNPRCEGKLFHDILLLNMSQVRRIR